MPYEPEFHRQGAVLLTRTGDASVWQFRNETGEGTMTTYELFPGVALSFNDFHMASFDSSFSTRQRLFAVDYCREGRMEYAAAAAAWPRSRPRWATAMPASLRPPLKRRPAARRWNTGRRHARKHDKTARRGAQNSGRAVPVIMLRSVPWIPPRRPRSCPPEFPPPRGRSRRRGAAGRGRAPWSRSPAGWAGG